jgi:hypothetical protein
MLVLAVISGIGLIVDDRTLVGAPIWLKPLKFGISLAIYTATMAWLISLLTRGRKAATWLGTVISVAALIEIIVIMGQAARGRQSHFNFVTALDATLFSIMGVTIVVVWIATLWIGVLLMIQRIGDRPIALAIRSGVIIALVGLAVGFLMTSPTPAQLTEMQAGAPPTIMGAHSVGVPDGGAGLPIVGWSTEGGDLRVGHFVGMHALQALPLLAFLLVFASRRFAGLRDELLRTRLVLIFAGVHAALTVLVTWQALRGQPVVSPDALTLTAFLAIVVSAGLALLVAFTRRPQAPTFTPAPAAMEASA